MNKFNTRRAALKHLAAAALGASALVQPLIELRTRPVAWRLAQQTGQARSFLRGRAGRPTCSRAIVAENLTKVYGQPFIVDNKPGASGNMGAMAVVKAPPDGYSLLFTASSFTIVPAALNPQQSYDVLKDLAPIAQVGVGGLFLAVSPKMPIKSVKDMFDLARANPGKYSYGTTGNGSTAHLIMLSLLSRQGVSMTHIPYKSSAEVLRDLVGGVLQIAWIDTTSSLSMVQSGKVRPLAIGATLRMPVTPDVPTFNEAGYPHAMDGWLAVFATAGNAGPHRSLFERGDQQDYPQRGRQQASSPP